MNVATEIITEAERLAEQCTTWADLSNGIFGPDGILAKKFHSLEEHKAFRKTADYEKLHYLVEQKMKETGVVEGATPTRKEK